MADQLYVNLIDNQPPDWLSRIKACILHTAVNVKIKAAPTTAEGPADALGRSVVADPDLWARRFAPVVAVVLIGSPDLTSASVTDAALFAAVDVAWGKFLVQPSLV